MGWSTVAPGQVRQLRRQILHCNVLLHIGSI